MLSKKELMSGIYDQQIEDLANYHVNHFQKLLNSKSTSVNHKECSYYLKVWEKVKNIKSTSEIDENGWCEILDACSSGDFDDYFV